MSEAATSPRSFVVKIVAVALIVALVSIAGVVGYRAVLMARQPAGSGDTSLCIEPAVPIGQSCAVVQCNDGFDAVDTACEPICQGDYTWVGSECEDVSIHCADGLTWTGTTCGTIPACSRGSIPIAQGCAVVVCGPGSFVDNAAGPNDPACTDGS